MTRQTLAQLSRFGVVGVIGFTVDGGLLYLLMLQAFDPFLARALTFPTAVTVTWYLNRRWTFAARAAPTGRGRDYWRYVLVQVAGAASNYAAYAVILLFVSPTPAHALGALALGALLGLLVNFAGSRWWVFVDPERASAAGRCD